LPIGRNIVAKAIELAKVSKNFKQRFSLHANLGVWFIDTGQHEAAARALGRADDSLGTLAVPNLRRNLLINRGLLAIDLNVPHDAIASFEESLRVQGANEYSPAKNSSLAGIGLAHLMSGRLPEARRISEMLSERPKDWTFDPFLWISFETRLSARTARNDDVLRDLEEEEDKLRETIALAWVRLRLLRFEILLKWSRSPEQKEVRELSHFLLDNNLSSREAELRKLLSRYRYAT
jgi:tetratricopeptide (TPR) repeat protein